MTTPADPAANAWRVSPGRVALGMLAGALVGGTLTVLFGEVFSRRPTPDLWQVWIGITVLWLVAIAGPGGLAWFVLHRWRRRGWRSALLVGALGPGLSSLLGFLVYALPQAQDSYRLLVGAAAALLLAVAVAAIGIAVALTIWRIAYRRGSSSDVAAVFS